MARRRDYAAEYARRQAKAHREGFSGYYEKRITEGTGVRPPADVRRLRAGHASAADLKRAFRSGRVDHVFQQPVGERDPKTGQYREVRVTVTLSNGDQRSYRLRGDQLRSGKLRGLQRAAIEAGADLYSNPSLDVLGVRSSADDVDAVVAELGDAA